MSFGCSWDALKFSPLRLVSSASCRSFWLSGHLFLAMQFISELIWVNVRWNGPTWQAKTIISCFSINSKLKRDVARDVIGTQRARISKRLKIADLRPISASRVPICDTDLKKKGKRKRNRAGFKTRPPALAWAEYKLPSLFIFEKTLTIDFDWCRSQYVLQSGERQCMFTVYSLYLIPVITSPHWFSLLNGWLQRWHRIFMGMQQVCCHRDRCWILFINVYQISLNGSLVPPPVSSYLEQKTWLLSNLV